MQSQKPSWRKARSSPAAASRSSGSRSSTLSAASSSSTAGLEAEEAAVDPVLGARLLAEARAPRPSPSSSATPNCSSGRTTVIVAGAPWRGVEGEQRVEVDVGHAVGVGRAERAVAQRASRARCSAPAGRRVQRRCPGTRPRRRAGHGSRGDEALDLLAPVAGAAAGSAGSPARGRSGSRARRSAARRSPPAAWGSTGCAPAGGCPARRRGSPRVGSRAHRRRIITADASAARWPRIASPRDLQGLRHPRPLRRARSTPATAPSRSAARSRA